MNDLSEEEIAAWKVEVKDVMDNLNETLDSVSILLDKQQEKIEMQSQPFKRVLDHFKLIQAVLASNPNLGLESLPKFQQAKGKVKVRIQ